MGRGVDLCAASAAPSFGSHAADRSRGFGATFPPLAGQSSARSMRREPKMRKEPRIAPGGGRGGQQRRFARGLICGPSQERQRADARTRMAAV